MTPSQRLSAVMTVAVSGVVVLLNGCASSRPQTFAMSFLPTTALPVTTETHIEQPPRVNSKLYANEAPRVKPFISPEVERRLKAAEERFESGRVAFQSGNVVLARREFDRALDVLLAAPENLADRHRIERRLDEMVETIYRYDLDELGAGEKKKAVVYDKSPLESMLEMTFPIDPKLKPQVKEEIQATVSQLPLEQNDTVLGYIHFFSTEHGRKTLISGLRRAGKYRPLIQRILDEEGVPQELIFLAQAESGFMPRAISYKSATGMWQFMQGCGKEYGLIQNASFDERLDPEKATRAAARHLRDLYATFGNWYLAMAAYNCGEGCVDRAVQRTGYGDFWELANRNALPRQTINYVPLILAMTIMSKNAKDYGLDNIDPERALEYDTAVMKSATSLELIADVTNRPVSEIRELNPALLATIAPADYQLNVPKGSSATLLTAIGIIPLEHRADWRMHRVELGETLTEIATRFRAQAAAIAAVNNRTVEAPEAGDLLVIPTSREPERSARTSRRTSHQAYVAARKLPHRTANGRTYAASVPPRILHHRAAARTVKTAGLYTHSAGR